MWITWTVAGGAALILGLIALVYGALPLLIKAQMKMRLDGTMQPVDPVSLPVETAGYFDRLAAALAPEGYAPAGYLLLDEMTPSVRMTLVLLVHPTRHAGVMGTVIQPLAPHGDPPPPKRTIECSSELQDGREINTGNSLDAVTPDLNPQKTAWVYPDDDDPRVLLRIHDAVCEELRRGTPYKPIPRDRSVQDFLLTQLRRDLDDKCERGYWTRIDDGYGLTLKGAYANTWAQLPPFKGRWQRRVRKRSDEMRRELKA